MGNELKQWEKHHKLLLTPPKMAWPTLGLFFVALLILCMSCYLTLSQSMPWFVGVIANGIALFMLFTVGHDASHRSLSQYATVNEFLGTASLFLLSPLAGIRVFRFIHMQHHRFTNQDRRLDPDAWCGKGHKLTLPFRWMSLDAHYVVWYLKQWHTRPKKERRELILTIGTSASLILSLCFLGFGLELFLLWFIPSRIAMVWLALGFDFLPHYPHDTTNADNPYHATNIRPNKPSFMTCLLIEQNYHLIHHLYPRVPFYRYHRIWAQTKPMLKKANARLYSWHNSRL